MQSVHDRPPRLAPQMARGALASLRKRPPYAEARLPTTRHTLRDAVIDPARLRTYQELCGDPAPGRPELPPAYPHLLAFPLVMRLMAGGDFPFPLLGLVHTHVELERTVPTPLRHTDRPTLTVYAEGAAPHRRGTRFEIVTLAELDGVQAWRSRSTYLCRHRTQHTSATPHDREPESPLPTRATWDLPAHLGRSYAAASGDRNPIHLHPLTAKPFGFRRPIAHGMWTFARCLAALEHDHEVNAAEADFKAPVPLPGQVTFAADPTNATFALRSTDGTRTHLTGHAKHT